MDALRETREWDAGHIAGARHVEMDRLTEEAGSLTGDPPVVFYCRTGGRSAVAAQAFTASGLTAYNMAGGLVLWVERGLFRSSRTTAPSRPTERSYRARSWPS